jgi:hypothetical protein
MTTSCIHAGNPCEYARFCFTCRIGPLRTGYYYCDEHYCDLHEPPNFADEYTDDGDDYWTEWPVEDDCDCPDTCECIVNPAGRWYAPPLPHVAKLDNLAKL